jgi:hypothetical protein
VALTQRQSALCYFSVPLSRTGPFDGVNMTLGHQFMELHNRNNKFDTTGDWRLFNKWRSSPGAANGLSKNGSD